MVTNFSFCISFSVGLALLLLPGLYFSGKAYAQPASTTAIRDNKTDRWTEKNNAEAESMLRRIAATGNPKALWVLGCRYAYPQTGKPDFVKAKRVWIEAATLNEPNAMASLSRLYATGLAGPSDQNKALDFAKRAADLDLTKAQLAIGIVYLQGYLREQDYQIARKYLERAANKGDGNAQCLLSFMYENGLGLPVDKAKAQSLMSSALANQCADGEFRIGLAYGWGIGQEKDYKKAWYWLERAAKHKSRMAKRSLAAMYFDGRGIKPDKQKGLALLSEISDGNQQEGKEDLADRYRTGNGLPKNLEKAEKLYQELADANVPGGAQGLLKLGLLYSPKTEKGERDDKKTRHLLERAAAASSGDSQALCYLADLSKRVHNDQKTAQTYYEKAAIIADDYAAINIAYSYLTEINKTRDYPTAMRLLKLCADKGNGNAENYLSYMYQEGLGVDKDIEKANELRRSANAHGCLDGDYMIGNLIYSEESKEGAQHAARWFEKSVATGNPHAKNQLAIILAMGETGAKPEFERSTKLRQQAANEGCPYALMAIADKYFSGAGVPKDLKKARILYERAVRMGNGLANTRLKELDDEEKREKKRGSDRPTRK